MHLRSYCKLLFLSFLISLNSFAQPSNQEIRSEFDQRVNAGVNAVTLFNSDMSVSAGNYKFDDTESDAKFDLFKLPYQHKFEALDNGMKPELNLLVANSKITSSPEMQPSAIGINDFSVVETNSFQAGVGLAIPILDRLSIIPRGSATYSHLKRSYDFNNSFSQTNLQPYDRDAYNTSIDIMTYTPSLELRYETNEENSGNYAVYTRYSQLYNHSFATKSRFADVDSDSGLLQSGLEYNQKLANKVLDREVYFKPYFVQTNLYGEAREALDVSYFHELGFSFNMMEKNPEFILSQYNIGLSYTYGEEFDGIKFELGFKL